MAAAPAGQFTQAGPPGRVVRKGGSPQCTGLQVEEAHAAFCVKTGTKERDRDRKTEISVWPDTLPPRWGHREEMGDGRLLGGRAGGRGLALACTYARCACWAGGCAGAARGCRGRGRTPGSPARCSAAGGPAGHRAGHAGTPWGSGTGARGTQRTVRPRAAPAPPPLAPALSWEVPPTRGSQHPGRRQ